MRWPTLALVLSLACDGTLQAEAPAGTHRLASGPVLMVGDGDSACSQPPAGGDVWCAFARTTDAGAAELWAVDVTRAARDGTTCDAPGPGCVRVSTALWTGDPLFSASFPAIDEFSGETLFVYEAPPGMTAHDDPFLGTIKAWRPGWPAARPVSSPKGYQCRGHARAAVAYCLDAVVQTKDNVEFDLLAGPLDPAASGPLPSAAHVRALGSLGQVMWGAAFSPSGQHLAVSAPAPGEDVEVLTVIKTADIGRVPAATLLRGAAHWTLSADGSKVYFLQDFNYDDRDAHPAGTLAMVDFPTGEHPTAIQPRVGDFVALGAAGGPDQGLGFLQDMSDGQGTLRLLRNRTQLDQIATVDSQVEDFQLSADLRYSYVFKPGGNDGPESVIARTDGGGRCPLNTRPGALPYLVTFLGATRAVMFAEDDAAGQVHGFYTDPEGCETKREFATPLAYLVAVRDGVLYAVQDRTGRHMTLRHARVDAGGLPGDGGELVADGADTRVALAGQRYVLYTVTDSETPGLAAFGPLP